MTLPEGTRIGPYEILAPIGAGGMGEVYRARDTRLDRDVAIKILPPLFSSDPERLARFEREAKTLASLNHPHIAQIYGLEPIDGTEGGRALVMEFVEGEDLSARIARGPIVVEEAMAAARQIADALAAAHERGIIHRDLKPANVKVRDDGTVKVLDFGLAKALDPAPGSNPDLMNSPTITSPATQMGMILGTAAYMAPEQAKGRAIDRRADVWAFGVVLFEMLTGKRVFEGGDLTEVLASVIKDTPSQATLPVGTPPAIRRLLRRCLEKNPARRLDSMAAARLEIDDAMGGSADSDMAAETITARRSAMRSLVPLALTALLLLAVGAGAAWRLKPSPVTDAPVARFPIPLPEGETLGSYSAPSLAVSRDGRRIAYRTGRSIYIRDLGLEEYEPREVVKWPGAGIWFSPDGQSLLFGTPSGLSRVAATGGRPQELVTAPAVTGADWHEDGTIIYATPSELSRIPETGGPPQRLIRAAPNTSVLAWPQRLPGDTLLYTRWQGSGTEPSTIVSALDGSKERVVLTGHSGRYVDTGHLLYGTEGRLHAVPFEPARGTVGGAPILVPESAFVSNQTAWVQIAVARSGTAVYVSSRSTENQTQLAWADGSGRTTVAYDVPRVYSDLKLAPDGRKVALHLWDEENDIWVADLVRGTLTRMTFTPGEEETPVWSPDGRTLAYAAERSGAPRALLSKAADGGATAPERTIWQTPNHFHVNDWSPDGRTIIVEIRRSGTANDLLAIDVESGKERALVASTFRERQARFSPDGRWIAYTSDESGRDEVYVQAYPSLDGRVTVSTSGGMEPIWARDGKRLFFRTAGQIMAAAVASASPIEFSAPAPFLSDTFVRAQGDTHTHFDVDADGRLLVINPRAGGPARERGQIHVVINWAARLRTLSAGR